MPKHAYLSASASHRWLACPPSAKLCANIADQTSEYAQQGTDCHELCAYLVEKALGRAVTDPTENLTFYDAEMQICAEEYRNYVLEQIEAAKEFCKDPQVMIEQRLDFSRWVENGFGTGDCVIVADEVLQIIDYKHGLGVLVSAGDEEHGGNSQMMCYALGALEAFGDIYDINQIKMTIFQPRRDNVSTYTISKDDLLKWAEEVLAPTAQLAYTGKGEFKAGDHCQFCKVKATCRKRAEYNLELAKYDFEMPATLDDIEIAAILAKVDEISKGFEPASPENLEETVMLRMIIQDLLKKIHEINPKHGRILDLICEDYTKGQILDELGLGKSQGYADIKAAQALAKKLYFGE